MLQYTAKLEQIDPKGKVGQARDVAEPRLPHRGWVVGRCEAPLFRCKIAPGGKKTLETVSN